MTRPKWNIPDQTRVSDTSGVEPSATDAARQVEADVQWRHSRPVSVNLTPPLNYWNSDNYRGLRIHTHPWVWRCIPIPFYARPYRDVVRVFLSYMTVDSSLRGHNIRTSPGDFSTNPGGDVDLFLSDKPALNAAGNYTALTPIVERGMVTVNDVEGVVELTLNDKTFNHYVVGGLETPFLYLWVRSHKAAEVPYLELGGHYAMDGRYPRRTALEAPLRWIETASPLNQPPAPVYGRLLHIPQYASEVVLDTDLSNPTGRTIKYSSIHPYSPYYFVENEGQEWQSPTITTYRRFTYPTFPTAPLDAALTSGAYEENGEAVPRVDATAIYETTGLIVKSLMLEQDQESNL